MQWSPLFSHTDLHLFESQSPLPRVKPETIKTRTKPKYKNIEFENNDEDSYEKYKGIAGPSLCK